MHALLLRLEGCHVYLLGLVPILKTVEDLTASVICISHAGIISPDNMPDLLHWLRSSALLQDGQNGQEPRIFIWQENNS